MVLAKFRAKFRGGNLSNLRKRVLSALILAPFTLAAVWYGGIFYLALIALISGIGLFEWLRLVEVGIDKSLRGSLFFLLFLILAASAINEWGLALGLLAFTTGAGWLVAQRMNCKQPWLVAFGLPYMAGSAIALIYLRSRPEVGLALAFYLLTVVWATDIGAYVVGRSVGGPKLAPVISPNKTWSGFLGGLSIAALLGALLVYIYDLPVVWQAGLLALPLAASAQAGDLFKSIYKRRAGVKDSGHLIPGHGGVLDRIDGLVAAAAMLAVIYACCEAAEIKGWTL